MSTPSIDSFVSHAEIASGYLRELENNETFMAYRAAKSEMGTAIKTLLKTEGVKASALLAAAQELGSPRVAKKVIELAKKQGADLTEKAAPITLTADFIAIAKDYSAKHEAALQLESYNAFRVEKKAYKAGMKSLLDSGSKAAELKDALEGKDIHSKFSKKVDYWTQYDWKIS